MHSNRIEAYKRLLHMTDAQREIVVGLMLGDGHLEARAGGRLYRLKVEQSVAHRAYVEWLYKELRPWVLTSPQEKVQYRLGRANRKLWFQTVSHPALRFYGQQFYPDGTKIVPRIIKKMMTPRALAVWFMDDGSIKSKDHRALILNTHAFDRQSRTRLQKALAEKFNIAATERRQRDGIQLQINWPAVESFVRMIEPYVIESMRYKFGRLRNNMPKR